MKYKKRSKYHHSSDYYKKHGWEIIPCSNCSGHGVVSVYSMYDFEGPGFCSKCDGSGTVWKTPKGRLVEYPGGKFV